MVWAHTEHLGGGKVCLTRIKSIASVNLLRGGVGNPSDVYEVGYGARTGWVSGSVLQIVLGLGETWGPSYSQ